MEKADVLGVFAKLLIALPGEQPLQGNGLWLVAARTHGIVAGIPGLSDLRFGGECQRTVGKILHRYDGSIRREPGLETFLSFPHHLIAFREDQFSVRSKIEVGVLAHLGQDLWLVWTEQTAVGFGQHLDQTLVAVRAGVEESQHNLTRMSVGRLLGSLHFPVQPSIPRDGKATHQPVPLGLTV
ncbi:MAG: hypothetical protein HY319_13305 [Armatimonadetes bacterium]|nr:hypothetical protein [Armatimonadota bacterium]